MDGITKIDGLLADLGVSSYQFDTSERGFSTRLNGDLDMRMDAHSNLTAKEVVNCYSEENLSDIFFNYGELRNSRVIAGRIVSYRQQKEIVTTFDLKNIQGDSSEIPVLIFETCGIALINKDIFYLQTGSSCIDDAVVLILCSREKLFQLIHLS